MTNRYRPYRKITAPNMTPNWFGRYTGTSTPAMTSIPRTIAALEITSMVYLNTEGTFTLITFKIDGEGTVPLLPHR